jgi:hypothetical protein
MSAHIDPAAFGEASGDARRSMTAHLRSCQACRDSVAAHDPVALLALLADAPVPRRILDEVSADVARRAGRDRGSFGAIVASAPSIRLRLAAAAMVGVALLGAYASLREHPVPPPLASASREAVPALSQRADVDVHPAQAVSQVVDFTVGDTQVVMVYNGDLKL